MNTGPYPASSSTPLYGAPVTDAYFLKSIEQAFLDFHRSGDYATFARSVRDVLVAWRGAS
jgi:hypothetical protein